ncbi:MAG: hypothetical protein M0026_00210 [Nocardiopsaceae bacterium]|nr:hypothetical protein [Nocardiopsaceae bacterium]
MILSGSVCSTGAVGQIRGGAGLMGVDADGGGGDDRSEAEPEADAGKERRPRMSVGSPPSGLVGPDQENPAAVSNPR